MEIEMRQGAGRDRKEEQKGEEWRKYSVEIEMRKGAGRDRKEELKREEWRKQCGKRIEEAKK